ncbi:M61 family metallopeptidase [Algibacillus agarilyticus]|uniref:M61 family metallopeptidase n=1 Tax=Algibacillus agarilyticus TaxID=2234133 RepID=UPI000DD0D06D|nr:PDZ domain-containing protein [Algibacillus agarilyticus]
MPHYQVTIPDPHTHLFHVTLTVKNSASVQSQLSLPSWIPGSYMVRDFCKNIVSIRFVNLAEQPINFEKIDKQTWLVHNNKQGYKAVYTFYAFDTSVRTAYLDQFRGFFNGTSSFIKVEEFAESEHQVEIIKPTACPDWQLATGLNRITGDTFDFGTFKAPNYLELIDYPFEMAAFTTETFYVKNIPHHIVISGKHDADMARIAQDLTPLCQHHLDYFSAPYPIEEYYFLINIVGDGFGGLEHLNSTALLCSRDSLPHKTDDKGIFSEKYQGFLSLCSHEYFHTWNVKRIKPAAFVTPDLANETYTKQLWFYEGITSYVDDFSLNATKLITAEQYLTTLAKALQRLFNNQGRFIQSAAESSFDAWTKFYKQDENATNAIVSYYTKGAFIALCLDLHIKANTNNQFCLQTIMQDYWHDFNQGKQGTTDLSIIDKVKVITGLNIESLFQDWVEGTNELPIDKYLSKFGVNLTLAPDTEKSVINTGLSFKKTTDKLIIQTVAADSIAQLAGLSANDEILALNHLKVVSPNDFNSQLKQNINQTIKLHVFRRDELFSVNLTLNAEQTNQVKLNIVEPTLATNWLVLP